MDSNLIRCREENNGELVDWLTDLPESTGNWYMSPYEKPSGIIFRKAFFLI